jgi:hypothetical protein
MRSTGAVRSITNWDVAMSGGSIVSGLDDMQNQKNALLQEKGQAEGHAKTLRDKAQVGASLHEAQNTQ